MNSGTKIRTVLVIATCLNTALLATDVAQFGNETINLIYKILSVAANFVIVFCATWFNNDYTEAAAIGTGVTRQLKAEKKADYIGDYFFADYDQEYEEESAENRGSEPDEQPIEGIIEEEIDEADIVKVSLDEVGERDE